MRVARIVLGSLVCVYLYEAFIMATWALLTTVV